MEWSDAHPFFWGFVAVGLGGTIIYLHKLCGLSLTKALNNLVGVPFIGVMLFGASRDIAKFSIQQALIITAVGVWVSVVTILLGHSLDDIRRFKEFDVPLQEVIALTVTLKREFFAECLNLPDDEIDNCSELISGFRVRLQMWKGHYAGDLVFSRRENGVAPERTTIWQFPTTPSQFPVYLGSAGLFRVDEKDDLFGPERLEVRFDPSSFIVKGRNGRFFKRASSDLVIPARTPDLSKFVDTFGQGDPDWLMATGRTRSYERDGRWARWSMVVTNPESLALNIRFLSSNNPVKLND